MSPLELDPPQLTFGSGVSDRHLPGSGEAIPTTILDTQYEYNGFVFNNRWALDCYWVSKIDGLSDADIRRSEEDNPDYDGANFHGALYGSRTFVITGWVLAGNLDKLEDMWFAFREAFEDIDQELPLYGRTGNIDRDWMIFCAKSASLDWSDEQTEYEFRRRWMLTLKASDPRIYSVREKSVAAASLAQYINRVTNPGLEIDTSTYAASGGQGAAITRVNTWSATGTWSGRVTGTNSTGANQTAGAITPGTGAAGWAVAPGESWMVAAEVRRVGTAPTVRTRARFYKADGSASATPFSADFSVAGTGRGVGLVVVPNDAAFLALEMYQSSSATGQTYDFNFDSVMAVKTTTILNFFDGGSLKSRWSGTANASTSIYEPDVNLVVPHKGNYRRGTFRMVVAGSHANFKVTNNATGQVFVLTGSIPAGSIYTIEFDPRDAYIVDETETNKFGQFDHTSDWLNLAKRIENILTIESTNRNATSSVTVFWRDQYK